MPLPVLGPLLASLLGAETAAGAAAAAGTAASSGAASGAAAGAAGQAASSSVTQAILQNAGAAAAGGMGGAGGAGGAGGMGGGGGSGGIGGGGGAGGAGGSMPPLGPGMGNFHQNLLRSIQGLEDFHEKLELAGSAATAFSSGEVDVLKRPVSALLGTFEQQIDQGISGKGLPTAGVQRGVDAAWKMSGAEFVSNIPILGIVPSIFKDIVDAAINLPNAIEQWGEALLNSRLKMARWNPTMAGVKVESERREILRNIASGSATSSTTQDLNSALQDLKDTMRPINDTLINGFNMLVTHLIRITDAGIKTAGYVGDAAMFFGKASPLLGPLFYMVDLATRYFSLFTSGSQKGSAWQNWMDQTANPPKNPPPGNK